MSFSTVVSAALRGLSVEFIQVEADISSGLPGFHMVGYLSSEVKEAGERVRTAIHNIGIRFPAQKTVINLSPGNVRKRGTSFDVPIAVSVLGAMGIVKEQLLKDTVFVGELGLDGSIRKVAGILPIVAEAKKKGYETCILPAENCMEGQLIEGIRILGTSSLGELCRYLTNEGALAETKRGRKKARSVMEEVPDFSQVKGQLVLKRAAEIAVSGGHNLLLIGPPGSGKSMAARRIPGILPPLDKEESMELTSIYSVMDMLKDEQPLITSRPFREVHHTATKAALVGGGNTPRPGEISLAHRGVLFLDELAEFRKEVLEVLRQPLEEKNIRLVRNQGSYIFPSDFMLVGAMNPCPCGNYPDIGKCTCTEAQIHQYLGKISQPFLDRMDLCVEVQKVAYQDLRQGGVQETSAQIRKRVCAARTLQTRRFHGRNTGNNAGMDLTELDQYCLLGKEEERVMEQAFESLGLTARTYHRVLKVARTIADLDREECIRAHHLKEALGYRAIDKKYWGKQ